MEHINNKIKVSGWEKALKIANIIILALIAFTMLYPFWEILVKSFMPDEEINARTFCIWPTSFQLDGYETVFTNETYKLGRAFVNSVFITVVGTLYQLAITAMTAYALTRKGLPGKGFFFGYFIFTMYFGGGMIPYYIVVRDLGLRNNIMVMIIPAFLNVFNMLVMRAFFQELPAELEEAAKIDGASNLKIFIQIVLPLSGAVMATIALFIAVGQWNNWYTAMLFLDQEPDARPLAYALQYIMERSTGTTSNVGGSMNVEIIGKSVQNAAIVVAVFPILVVYPFFQKHFVKGVLTGSIKG